MGAGLWGLMTSEGVQMVTTQRFKIGVPGLRFAVDTGESSHLCAFWERAMSRPGLQNSASVAE